jgi:hypothetical protein
LRLGWANRMHLLESALFLLDIARSYAKPAAAAAVANIGTVVAVRAFLPTFHLALLSRGGGFVIAGCVGGLLSVVEAFAAVELSGLRQEAAGMALAFLPFVLAPTAVAALSWLFSTTNWSRRSTLALVGAVAGALVASPLAPILVHYAMLLPGPSNMYVPWMLVGMPLAAGATLGCVLVRSATRSWASPHDAG